MSSDDDKCFQCQESGHMACHCPRIKCFDCDEYGHVMADCQTRYHHQVDLQGAETPILPQGTMIDLHLTIATGTDIGPTGHSPIPAVIDTEATFGAIHKEVAPGHTTDAHTEAYCTTDTMGYAT